MALPDDVTFLQMYREMPVRTTVATVVPLLLGITQFLNGYLHGVNVMWVAGFTAGLLVAAVLVTRIHLVQYRREKLQQELVEE